MNNIDVLNFIKKYSLFPENNQNTYTLEEQHSNISEFIFSDINPQNYDIKSNNSKISICKKSGLTTEEKTIFENITKKINNLIQIPKLSPYEINSILEITQLESIIKCLPFPQNDQPNNPTVSFLMKHIKEMEYWSSQTYENMNICFSIGIDFNLNSNGPNISTLYQDDMLKVLTSGIGTLIVCDKKGNIDSFIDSAAMYHNSILTKKDDSVYTFRWIQEWSKDRIAIILTNRGDILIFANNELKFVKRFSKWHLVKMSDLNYHMPNTREYNENLKSAIAETCLDISFKRTGACIGIITNPDDIQYLVDDDDLIDRSNKSRIQFLKKAIGNEKFHNISRAIRQELAAIDGAIVLGKDGTIFAIGAILKIAHTPNDNRTTGGRSVAAQHLACYGVGIKISADGGITAWRNNKIPKSGCPWNENSNHPCTTKCGFEKYFELF